MAAYGSDDQEEEGPSLKRSRALQHPLSSRHQQEAPASCVFIGPSDPPTAPLSSAPHLLSPTPLPLGRYVSKRERAAASSSILAPSPLPQQPLDLESLFHIEAPWSVQQKMKPQTAAGHRSQLPRGLFVQLKAHTKAVTAVRWSPAHSSLLVSAGMDGVAHVWNAWSNGPGSCAARSFTSHTAAIKDVQWSLDGASILTCGFDQTSRLHDLETGVETQVFKEDQYVHVVKFHPMKKELFISGGSKGVLKLWDVRTGDMVQEYRRGQGQVMDVDFNREGKHFVSASDIADRNASDRTIVVWDFATQIPLSNQVYLEAYTCPCVRYHPFENVFVAQSNGNYIALFSGYHPFRMNKYKRFEGHEVSGYRIQCNFSPDGELLISGSSNGGVYIYQYRSTKVLKVLEAHMHVCTDVSYHPSMPSVLASGGWEGNLSIFV